MGGTVEQRMALLRERIAGLKAAPRYEDLTETKWRYETLARCQRELAMLLEDDREKPPMPKRKPRSKRDKERNPQ